MEQIKLINIENATEEEVAKYRVRQAARAIVFDEDGNIALLNATNNHYYKLPGGGIEEGEDKEIALKRECKEEIGCDVEIVKEVGIIVEYRKNWGLKQTSYCYVAKVVGEKGEPTLEQSEIDEGFETVWLAINEALKKVKQSKPVIYDGPYMVARDSAFLEKAKEILK